jgi:hypothetical protein
MTWQPGCAVGAAERSDAAWADTNLFVALVAEPTHPLT